MNWLASHSRSDARLRQAKDLSPAVSHDQQPVQRSGTRPWAPRTIHRSDAARHECEEMSSSPVMEGRLLRTMYLVTLVCPTSNPSLSSSPWILGAPHSGLARLIVTDQPSDLDRYARTTWSTPRLPAPVRSKARAMPSHNGLRSNDGERARKRLGTARRPNREPTLSAARNGNRADWPRRSTMICWRSTRTSASSAARDRNRSRTRPRISLIRPNIRANVAQFSTPRQSDSISDSDNLDQPCPALSCSIDLAVMPK